MNNNNYIYILLLFLSPHLLRSQLNRGSFITPKNQCFIEHYYENNHLILSELRSTTNFLTDDRVKAYKKHEISKRKKAFKRHVKHISESLEESYLKGEKRSPSIDELLIELEYLKLSIQNKAISNSVSGVSFFKKVSMFWNTARSRYVFKYKIPKKVRIDSLSNETLFWHDLKNIEPYKRFDYLAKLKKVKPKKNMIVLFKELSLDGSAPKIKTRDLDLDNEWTLKWGDEVHTDVVGSRIFAALGYDVDHPYHYQKEHLTLVFDSPTNQSVTSKSELVEQILKIYGVDLNPFIYNFGTIDDLMIQKNKKLQDFKGKAYVQFIKCAIEARPDRVKRLGSFLPNQLANKYNSELRGAVLAHHFIGNWDTREENTLLTTIHQGNKQYIISAVFSDLGTSLGVSRSYLPADFKVGLVNELPWDVVTKKKNKIKFNNKINEIFKAYKKADYEELKVVAKRIALLTEKDLKEIIKEADWPKPIEKLYFHKLASRRASILKAFCIQDPHQIIFDKEFSYAEDGVEIIKNGILLLDYDRINHPESFYNNKGRLRNYGN